MYATNVYRLSVSISDESGQEKITFEKEGNYGNNWNYGQVTLNETSDFKVCSAAFFFLFSFILAKLIAEVSVKLTQNSTVPKIILSII